MKFDPATEHADLARWKIALIAAALLAIVAAVMFWSHRFTSTQSVVGMPGMFPHEGAITSVEELVTESTKANLAGRQVVLTYAEVHDAIDDDVFSVGHGSQTVPVVILGELVSRRGHAADDDMQVSAGDRAHILGIVQLSRGAHRLLDGVAIGAKGQEAVREHEIFISALQVSLVPDGDKQTMTADEAARELPRVITSVSELAAHDTKALQARHVVLDEVRVLRVLGDHTFIVGDEQATAAVALFGEMTERQTERATVIRAGDVVRIYGVVRRLRSVDEIEEMHMLTADEEAQLRSHAVYVSALRVVQLEPSS